MAEPKSYIRTLQGVAQAPAIDLYVNEQLMEKSTKYKDFSNYFEAVPGIYNIKLVPSLSPKVVLLSQNIAIDDQGIYTLAIVGDAENIDLELIYDRKKDADKTKTYIRYINISPQNSAFDIYMNGQAISKELLYQEISGYLKNVPGNYHITVKDSVSGKSLLVHPRAQLGSGRQYAGYIVGKENTAEGLEILLPLEGATYLRF